MQMCKAAVARRSLFHHIQSCCHNSHHTPGSLWKVLSKGFREPQLEALKSNLLMGGYQECHQRLGIQRASGKKYKKKDICEETRTS